MRLIPLAFLFALIMRLRRFLLSQGASRSC